MATVFLLDLTEYAGESGTAVSSRSAARHGYTPINTAGGTPMVEGAEGVSSEVVGGVAPCCALPPPVSLAWIVAAELLRWPSWSLAETAWATAYHAHEPSLYNLSAGEAQPSAPSYTFLDVPERLHVVTRYFSASIRVVVGSGSAAATLEALHRIAQLRASAKLPGATPGAELPPFAVVFVAKCAQDPSSLPWHVFAGAGSLANAVIVFNDEDEDDGRGGLESEGSHTARGARKEQWHDACVSHGFEYIPHGASTGQTFEHVDVGAERAGLLGPTLRGSSRLLQMLHSVLWPIHVRSAVADKEADGLTETVRDNGNHVVLVATAAGQAALLSRLRSAPSAPQHLSRYNKRFFTDVVPVDAARASTAGQNSGAVVFESALSANARSLLLANRYQTALVSLDAVHPLFFLPSHTDVLRRLLEQRVAICGGGAARRAPVEQDDSAEAEEAEDGFAVIVWPPRESGLVGEPLDQPSLLRVLDALRANHITNVVVVDASPPLSPLTSATGLTVWDRHACDERGVEVIRLDEQPGDDADEDGPCGVDRLQEWLHSIRWQPAPLTPEDRWRTARADAAEVNHVRVVCCGDVEAGGDGVARGGFANALEEERWLRAFYNDVLAPLSVEAPGAAVLPTITPVASCLVQHCPSLVLPVMLFCVRNRYFSASLALDVEGGLASALSRRSPTPSCSPHAVVVITNAQAILTAAESTHGGGTIDPASTRVARLVCDLQATLAEEARRQSLVWATGDVTRLAGPDSGEAETLAAVYILDVASDDDARVEQVEAALCTLLHDEDGEGGYPLFERVWRAPAACVARQPEGHRGAADVASVDGAARLCEALSQHVWPHRREVRPQQSTARTDAGVVDVPGPSAATVSQTSPEAQERDKKSEEEICVDRADVVAVGCELPPDFLVDPATLRSVRVHALRSGSVNVCHSTRLTPAQEIQQWVDAMRVHGANLSPSVRKHQAAVLALAMESVI